MGKQSKSSSSAPSKPSSSSIDTALSSINGTETVKKPKQRTGPRAVKSGNAGNSGNGIPTNSTAARDQKAIEEGRAPPLFPVGYKTPMNLLQEKCAKNKWQKPDYHPFKTPSGGHSCFIILSRQDPKLGLESVKLQPPSAPDSPIHLDKPTSLEAKNWCAVYALHRFCSDLQMSMVLPPVCRDYWHALQADKKEELSKDKRKEWKWLADPFEGERIRKTRLEAMKNGQQGQNSASATGSGQTSANASGRNTPTISSSHGGGLPKDTPEIKMSAELRKIVQDTIRKMRELNPPMPPAASSASSTSSVTVKSEQFTLTKEEKADAVRDLQSLGYRKGHIESALKCFETEQARYDPLLEGLSKTTIQETLLQYLQITLSEEELPGHGSSSTSAHNQHHTHGHGYQSSDPTVRITKRHEKETSLARNWLVDKIVKKAGYPEESVEEAVEASKGDEVKTILLLLRKLAGWKDNYAIADEELKRSSEDEKEIREKMETEVEALESLLGNAVHRVGKTGLEITVRSSTSKTCPPLLLHLYLKSPSGYPSPAQVTSDDSSLPIPTFYLTNPEHTATQGSAVPPYIRLHLTMQVMEKMRSEWRDIIEAGEGGVIYEMVTYLQEQLDQVLHHPPPSSQVFRFLRPDDDALDNGMDNLSSKKDKSSSVRGKNTRSGQPKPIGDSETLLKQYQALQEDPAYMNFLKKRKTLPAYSARTKLISLISANRVTIVSGATGSGKTTQVPTFILEDAIEHLKGGNVNIICTQPRRISAIGVANRVAQERTEEVGKEGSLVGYAIRGERKASRECRLLFCTTGILLQRLSRGGDPNLDNVSHVFVDEVHERSLDSDFLLLILKKVLQRNPRIKIILMSATADSTRFSSYFDNAPCIEIPGTTFPVEDLYLEDVIQYTRYKAPSLKASRKYSIEENERIKTSLMQRGIEDEALLSTLGMLIRAEKIDYELIAATVEYVHGQYDQDEAILVFVTGVAEITQTIRAIERLPVSRSMAVMPLHANLTNAEQSRIFGRVGGKRKVIVSTNVAETSITVDDVVHVIDTGRVKETRFEPESGLQRLVEDWNSLAGSRQRRGRAGRTKSGKCWRLYSKYQEDYIIPKYTKPEILRTPLASLVLQVKALRGEKDVLEFLRNALDAPDVKAIQEALDTLTGLGAIEDGEKENASTARLTPLGQNLALLPLDLRLGKMLILASIFDVLEPMLYICAALSTKPLFTSTPETRDAAQAARNRFSIGHSDLLTDLNAISSIVAIQSSDSDSSGATTSGTKGNGESKTATMKRFYEENHISPSAWREILSLKSDFVSALKSAGFNVPPSRSRATLLQEKDENLLKAIIYAGTGKAVRIKLPQVRYENTIGGTAQIDHEAKEVRFFDGDDGRVFIHPGSVLFSNSKLKNGYLTYFNKNVTSKPFLRDATELPLYALLLFGRSLKADPLRGGLTISASTSNIDNMENASVKRIHLRAPPRTSVLVNELRRLMDLELERLIDDPTSLEDHRSPVIESMMTLLRRNGS